MPVDPLQQPACMQYEATLFLRLSAASGKVYTHASGSAQRDAVNMLAGPLFPNVLRLDGCRNTARKNQELGCVMDSRLKIPAAYSRPDHYRFSSTYLRSLRLGKQRGEQSAGGGK